jgi:hypothetical protein
MDSFASMTRTEGATVNQKRSIEKQPKPLRSLSKDALRQVSGGLITEIPIPKLDGDSKDAR